MKSYKHLDSLCRDMNGIGITVYLEDMEQEAKKQQELSVPLPLLVA